MLVTKRIKTDLTSPTGYSWKGLHNQWWMDCWYNVHWFHWVDTALDSCWWIWRVEPEVGSHWHVWFIRGSWWEECWTVCCWSLWPCWTNQEGAIKGLFSACCRETHLPYCHSHSLKVPPLITHPQIPRYARLLHKFTSGRASKHGTTVRNNSCTYPLACQHDSHSGLYSVFWFRCLAHVVNLANIDVMSHITNIAMVENKTAIWEFNLAREEPYCEWRTWCYCSSLYAGN